MFFVREKGAGRAVVSAALAAELGSDGFHQSAAVFLVGQKNCGMTWLMDKCDYALTDGSDFFSEVEQIIYGQIVITGDQTGVHFRSEALLFRIQNSGAESGKPVVKLLVLRRLCVVFAEQVIISCGHTVSYLRSRSSYPADIRFPSSYRVLNWF